MSNKDELNKIVGEHLGKAGDGSAVNPYITPDAKDKTLLVPVPRWLNRKDYDIGDDDFVGYDTWNCYEVSALLSNGYPLSGVVKIVYPSNSEFIVESKSLKLYLNSFNMWDVGKDVSTGVCKIHNSIKDDLEEALQCEVDVRFFRFDTEGSAIETNKFTRLESYVDIETVKFDAYEADPAIIEVINSADPYTVTTSVLRSNCRVTNQPDWGDIFIAIEGVGLKPSSESLLKFIVSMRRENHFHEEICEAVYKAIIDRCPGNEVLVTCLYTRRGGIDINPTRATKMGMIEKYNMDLVDVNVFHQKTARQ